MTLKNFPPEKVISIRLNIVDHRAPLYLIKKSHNYQLKNQSLTKYCSLPNCIPLLACPACQMPACC